MTNNVRRLALDIGFAWLVPFQLLAALVLDYGYLLHPDLSMAFATGVMLSLQATTTTNKIALWRILPVTRQDIGRARWWQMTGLPGIGIVTMMGAALLLHALLTAMGWSPGPLRAGMMAILRDLLLQFFYPVFLTLFALAMTFVRVTRSPWAWVALIASGLPWLLLLPHAVPGMTGETRILVLGLFGLAAAAILYVTAPRWPLPVTQPMQLDIGGNRAAVAGGPGEQGWLALCAMALLRALPLASLVLVLYVGMIFMLRLDSMLILQMEFFTVAILLLQITVFNAAALRALRALPASTLALTAYLFLLPLTLVAAWICFFSLVLVPWLIGDIAIIDVVSLSAALFAGALALPAALAVRQAAMSLIILSSVALMGLVQFGWVRVRSPWHDERLLEGLALLAIALGFYWTHRQISRGTQVYRLQPFAAARWRGSD